MCLYAWSLLPFSQSTVNIHMNSPHSRSARFSSGVQSGVSEWSASPSMTNGLSRIRRASRAPHYGSRRMSKKIAPGVLRIRHTSDGSSQTRYPLPQASLGGQLYEVCVERQPRRETKERSSTRSEERRVGKEER